MNQALSRAGSEGDGGGEAGRSILEAVIGLSLVALAVVSWSRASLTATRVEATADHRAMALELATNELEALTVRDWSLATIDPEAPGVIRSFEGRSVVAGRGGVAASSFVTSDGRTFEITRSITDSGDPAWRHAVVIVAWMEGLRSTEVRLDGALRRPDPGTGL